MTSREVAVDVQRVSHAWVADDMASHVLITLCGVRARWRHLISWWSPAAMVMEPGMVSCMSCLVAEARQ